MNLRIRMSVITLATCAALLLLTSGAMAAPSFVNNSFEVDATTGFQSVDPTGWTTFRVGAPPYLINNNTYGNTPYGSQFLALGGIEDNAASWIEQTVSGFNVNQTYTLSWAQSSEYTSSDELRVSFTAGSNTASQIFTSVPFPGGGQFWFTWQNFSMSFVPSATSVTFHFQGVPNLTPPSYEVGVDNFQISGGTGTPEPGTLVMLGSGVLGLAGILRRKINV
jgi:hypothetical protein